VFVHIFEVSENRKKRGIPELNREELTTELSRLHNEVFIVLEHTSVTEYISDFTSAKIETISLVL
jgi:hypothetical protein